MKNFFTLLITTTLCHFQATATWSIIVADPKTKQIGIAGASCTRSVYGIGAIVPGKGAIVVQAMSNGAARLQGFRMIMDGAMKFGLSVHAQAFCAGLIASVRSVHGEEGLAIAFYIHQHHRVRHGVCRGNLWP